MTKQVKTLKPKERLVFTGRIAHQGNMKMIIIPKSEHEKLKVLEQFRNLRIVLNMELL